MFYTLQFNYASLRNEKCICMIANSFNHRCEHWRVKPNDGNTTSSVNDDNKPFFSCELQQPISVSLTLFVSRQCYIIIDTFLSLHIHRY